jgi:2-polyprenyl-3-methyl-5-hydroxy-6-metoxy-1,4-benzoquinol methylase
MSLVRDHRKSESKSVSGERQKGVDSHFAQSVSKWDEIYRQQNEMAVMVQGRQSIILKWIRELGLSPDDGILDIGAGAGLTTVALAASGHRVVAADTVLGMLRRTLEHAAETDIRHRTTAVASDIQHLSFSSGSFGLVLAIGVVPYVQSPQDAVAEIARTLRSGGHVIVTTHNLWGLSELLDPATFFDPRKSRPLAPVRRAVKNLFRRAGLWPLPHPGFWAHPHSMRTVDKWLFEASFEKLRSMTIGFGPFTCFNHRLLPRAVGIKLHHRLQTLADRNVPVLRSTGIEYIVLARKLRS